MVQYLKCNADVENGAEWSIAGAGTAWEALDGDSGTNPPTSDGDTRNVNVSNGSLAGATSPFRIRVALGSPTGDPIKHTGHTVNWTWRRVGAGSFGSGDAWPPVMVWQNGTVIAGPIAQTRPGTTYVDLSYTLSSGEAAAITDYTQLEIGWNDPTVGTGSCNCLITRAWMELPTEYSLECSLVGDSDGTCGTFASASSSASLVGDSDGTCAAFGEATGSFSLVGSSDSSRVLDFLVDVFPSFAASGGSEGSCTMLFEVEAVQYVIKVDGELPRARVSGD